jgi:hypothetical protein
MSSIVKRAKCRFLMDRWTQYLFEEHSESELRAWAQRLKFFRFFRAQGGHVNDGDSLDVAFAYRTTSQLKAFLRDLGVEVVRFDAKPPQPELGISYAADIFAEFPSLISGTTWLKQPGHCKVMGIHAFIWCAADRVKISIGADYRVSEQNVIDAERLELVLDGVALERIDPPRDSKNYICPRHYPDFFRN